MEQQARETAILIPSYQPDDKLPAYVAALREAGMGTVIVVDDGSGPDYAHIFGQIQQDESVRVLHYTPNRGKGVALKHGMRYLLEECPGCRVIITADSDGQHTVPDILRMCESLHENAEGLLLGSRDFSQENVPFKSRNGNRITTAVFFLLYGHWITDTQTGLRGFSRDLLPALLAAKGERFECEMNMLIDCAARKVPIRSLPIQTVYDGNNEGSHFRAVRDSARIYRVILDGFFRFIFSSLIGFLADYSLFYLFNSLLAQYIPELDYHFRFLFIRMLLRILIATAASRTLSGVINFLVNKHYVFADRKSAIRSFPRYVTVFLLLMFLSAGFTSSFHIWFGLNENAVKLPVDVVLFFLSYWLQRKWVFAADGVSSRGGKGSGHGA